MKVETITVRLPEEITKWLDSLIEQGIYNSRSEAIRDFAREYLEISAPGKKEVDD